MPKISVVNPNSLNPSPDTGPDLAFKVKRIQVFDDQRLKEKIQLKVFKVYL